MCVFDVYDVLLSPPPLFQYSLLPVTRSFLTVQLARASNLRNAPMTLWQTCLSLASCLLMKFQCPSTIPLFLTTYTNFVKRSFRCMLYVTFSEHPSMFTWPEVGGYGAWINDFSQLTTHTCAFSFKTKNEERHLSSWIILTGFLRSQLIFSHQNQHVVYWWFFPFKTIQMNKQPTNRIFANRMRNGWGNEVFWIRGHKPGRCKNSASCEVTRW